MAHQINRKARNYRDCMTPDETFRRCRPGSRSDSPEEEARRRNEEILEARGELVTLFTRKIRGDDIVDRELDPPKNNYVSALPLNFMYRFDATNSQGPSPQFDSRFTENLSIFLSDPKNMRMERFLAHNRQGSHRRDSFKPIQIIKRADPGQTNYFYVGNRGQFFNVSIKLFTALLSDTLTWEYSLGNGNWAPVPINTSETTAGAATLQESGRIVFNTSIASTWKEDFINGEKSFWVRARGDESVEGEACAVQVVTENVIQCIVLWNEGDDPFLFPNEKCVTIKVNDKVYNRVYNLKKLDYAQESFFLMRRNEFSEKCGVEFNLNPNCGQNPFDTCETDPLEHLNEIGNCDIRDTRLLKEMAFLHAQIMRMKQYANADAMLLFFTRNLLLDGASVTATYENQCPCVGFYRGQALNNKQMKDDSVCNICFGTEHVMGYERFVNPDREDGKILMSFPAAPFDKPLEQHGLSLEHRLSTARMAHEPRIFVRDLIIRYDEFGEETLRYIVNTRTDSRGRRGVLLHQEMETFALDPDKFEYKIQAPSLPLDPTQEQVLQSLGVLVPPQPADPGGCIKLRLEKGIELCRPERKRSQE